MALPLHEIEFAIDPNALTLGEVRIISGRFDIEQNPVEFLLEFAGFLSRHSNLTEAEINALTLRDIQPLIAAAQVKAGEAAVPLASAPPSAHGAELNLITLPSG